MVPSFALLQLSLIGRNLGDFMTWVSFILGVAMSATLRTRLAREWAGLKADSEGLDWDLCLELLRQDCRMVGDTRSPLESSTTFGGRLVCASLAFCEEWRGARRLDLPQP